MRTNGRSGGFVLLVSLAVAGSARAAEAPLLVVAEVSPDLGFNPGDVRQAVAGELGVSVVGAGELPAVFASAVLLVGVDAHELRMSLRPGGAPAISWTIAMPSDRPGRLRAIGWLAGNLVRDQVGPIVAVEAARPPATPTEPSPATEPPPAAEMAPRDAAPAAVVAGRLASRDDNPAHTAWAITVGGGPTELFWNSESARMFGGGGGVYEAELQHQATQDSLLVGAVLQLGPQGDRFGTVHYMGAAAFVGSRWQPRRWFVEGTAGLGLELVGAYLVSTSVINSSQTGTSSTTTVSRQPEPAIYARLQGAAGVRLSGMFDLVAQLGVHVSSEWKGGSYLSPTLGVRMRLP